MALRYKDIFEDPKRLISLTGFKKEEFETLNWIFSQQWEESLKRKTIEGKERQRRSALRKNSTFPQPEDKLLFILHYQKCYPLQEVMGVTFGIKQPQVNRWIKLLSHVLKKTLYKF